MSQVLPVSPWSRGLPPPAWVCLSAGFLHKERSLILALLQGRIRLRGNLRLLLRFARCFPT